MKQLDITKRQDYRFKFNKKQCFKFHLDIVLDWLLKYFCVRLGIAYLVENENSLLKVL